MLRKLLCCLAFFIPILATAQYKNDNTLFKTVSPDELCHALENNKGYLLLDVRSPGEHDDTSQYSGLNIGHLKAAVNINVRELGTRLSEINSYKDKPVFVYCSHSQRSRRASKMLVDSGFTNVYNVNGGLTAFYYTNAKAKGCLPSLIETNNKYQIISAIDLCNKLSSGNKDLFVLDVRYDSGFRHISTDVQDNAYGYIKGAVNIPLAELDSKLNIVPKDKDIVIIDLTSTDAAKAAALLTSKDYKRVSFMIEGMDRFLGTDENELSCKKDWYISPVSYHIMSTKEFGRLSAANKELVFLDTRPEVEFSNKATETYKNVGHLKDALNIPAANIGNRLAELEKYKNKDIIIYGFGGDHDCYDVANTLTKSGFKKINVLVNGLFDIRWTAANIKGQEKLKDLVTDIPEANK